MMNSKSLSHTFPSVGVCTQGFAGLWMADVNPMLSRRRTKPGERKELDTGCWGLGHVEAELGCRG